MEINQETISHLSELSNFALEEAEKKSLEANIREILSYVSQLDELDTAEVEPTYQVLDLQNIWRSDEIQPQEANPEQLLTLTKETERHQIKVPKVL